MSLSINRVRTILIYYIFMMFYVVRGIDFIIYFKKTQIHNRGDIITSAVFNSCFRRYVMKI